MPLLLAPEQAIALDQLLAEANVFGVDCQPVAGSGNPSIRGLGSLLSACPEQISFLSNPKLQGQLEDCRAAAVIVTPEVWEASLKGRNTAFVAVLCSEPYLMYALLAQWFDRHRLAKLPQGIHPSAVIADTARLEEGVNIGPHCVIEEGVTIGRGSRLGPGCVIGAGSSLRQDCLLHARVTLYHGVRIGDRARPLAAKTMRRIEVGLRMFARPTVVAHSGQTWDAADPRHPGYGDPASYYRAQAADTAPLMTRQAGGSGDALTVPPHMIAVNHDGDARAQLLDAAPLPTRSTKIGEGMVFPPFVSKHYGARPGDEYRNIEAGADTLGTIVASGSHHSLVVPPFMTEFYGTGSARAIDDEALSTVTAGANHHGLAVPPEAFLSRQYGSRGPGEQHLNTSIMEPTHPITASGGGNHALVVPSRERPVPYEGNLPFDLDDVRFRMLGPREHLRAQRFTEDYDTSAANKSETTKGAGNAVAVNVAHWIGASVKEVI